MAASAIAKTLLAYEPVIDRSRKTIAMRLTARSRDRDPVDAARLYTELAGLWPQRTIPVLLRCATETLPPSLLNENPAAGVWVELPPGMTATSDGLALSSRLWDRGFVQVLGGRPYGALPPELLPAFRMAIIHVATDRRLRDGVLHVPGPVRSIPYVQDGVNSIALLKSAFDAGASACIGWPFDDAILHSAQTDASPDFATITQLLSMIDRGAGAAELDRVVRRDAALAYRLLRYINAAAFGLGVEIQSFQHAVMLLGHERLKRWLLLMLVTASRDANMRPLMFASFRRGLFMEHLIGAEGDHATRDAVFILGVLSLLDKLFCEPLPDLLEKLHVREEIRDALLDRGGPFGAYLGIAEAVEREPGPQLLGLLDATLVSVERCNRALIRAITARESVSL